MTGSGNEIFVVSEGKEMNWAECSRVCVLPQLQRKEVDDRLGAADFSLPDSSHQCVSGGSSG